MLNEKRKEELVNLCREMVQNQSISGEEGQVVGVIKKALKNLGYDDVYVDAYGNVIGHIKGSKPGKKLLFDGHIDTVPVPDDSK